MSERRCGTCKHWAKPKGARALKDRCYPCVVPLPSLSLPACVGKAIGRILEIPARQPMERDEGNLCAFWEKKQ